MLEGGKRKREKARQLEAWESAAGDLGEHRTSGEDAEKKKRKGSNGRTQLKSGSSIVNLEGAYQLRRAGELGEGQMRGSGTSSQPLSASTSGRDVASGRLKDESRQEERKEKKEKKEKEKEKMREKESKEVSRKERKKRSRESKEEGAAMRSQLESGLDDASGRGGAAAAADDDDGTSGSGEEPSSAPKRKVVARPRIGGRKKRQYAADADRTDVKRGRWSREEKGALKRAIIQFARKHGYPEDDFQWVHDREERNTVKKIKGFYVKLAQSIPHRTIQSVRKNALLMTHHGNHKGKFTVEETEKLRSMVGKLGRNWTRIGEALGRWPDICRDHWRIICLGDNNLHGKWSGEELHKLKLLVEAYIAERKERLALRARQREQGGEADEDKPDVLAQAGEHYAYDPEDHRIVRDCVDWELIAQQMGTRNYQQCREKWYIRLAPTLIARNEWGYGDDLRMLRKMVYSGYENEWEVEWDQLVPQRGARPAKQRWRSMLKSIFDYREMSFSEQLTELCERRSYQKELPKEDSEGSDAVGSDTVEAS